VQVVLQRRSAFGRGQDVRIHSIDFRLAVLGEELDLARVGGQTDLRLVAKPSAASAAQIPQSG
jgi:hypothetical protein